MKSEALDCRLETLAIALRSAEIADLAEELTDTVYVGSYGFRKYDGDWCSTDDDLGWGQSVREVCTDKETGRSFVFLVEDEDEDDDDIIIKWEEIL